MTKETSKKSEQNDEKKAVNETKEKKDTIRTLRKVPKFLVRQLYRMQYGFTKSLLQCIP